MVLPKSSIYSHEAQYERIPNLTGEQSDGITVFRIPPMTSLMLHRCRTGAINLQRLLCTKLQNPGQISHSAECAPSIMAVDIGHIRQHVCLTLSQAIMGNIEGGEFDPVLWIEFGVAQWSERLERRTKDPVIQSVSKPEQASQSSQVRLECASASASASEVRVQWTAVGGPEFECSGPQLEGPEFEYSELSLKVCGSRYRELEYSASSYDERKDGAYSVGSRPISHSYRVHLSTCVDFGPAFIDIYDKEKRNWLGHWLRRNCLLKDALEVMVDGRRVRDKSKYQIDDIKIYGSYGETKMKAENRFKLRHNPSCACGAEEQTVDHLLFECPKLDKERLAFQREMLRKTGKSCHEVSLELRGPPIDPDALKKAVEAILAPPGNKI
ncbi:hypothetical protein ANN_03554 [Periplaneta americana]|uniref:Ig-like domain-containing protein n=1 Tax=Periplaneta americana TaxID=6978 RepID=A0ABQ8TZ66_PERAM|nr:hypothetical protein ANN_03554 [Periplaneta americana]